MTPAPGNEEAFEDVLKRLSTSKQECNASEIWSIYQVAIGEHPLTSLHPQLKISSRVILVQRSQPLSLRRQNEEESSSSFKSDGDLSLEEYGGSPLKLQSLVDYDELDNGASFKGAETRKPHSFLHGVAAADARRLMQLYYCQASSPDNSCPNLLPLWIACDNRSPEQLAYLGVEKASDGAKSGLVTYKVTAENIKMPAAEEMTSGRIMDTFRWCCDCSTAGSVDVLAQYAVDTAHGPHERPTAFSTLLNSQLDLVVEATWTKVASALQNPPPDSQCRLRIRPVCGDARSPIHGLYVELLILKDLLASLEGSCGNHFTFCCAAPKQTKSGENALDSLRQLLYEESLDTWPTTDTTNSDTAPKDCTGNGGSDLSSTPTSLQTFSIEPRQEMDFCDKLWIILKSCHSYLELCECFNEIERNLKNSKSPPMVYQTNESVVGQWILDVQSGRRVPHGLLEAGGGSRPLLLLLELGLDKMRRDYVTAFIGKSLASASQLEAFLTPHLPATHGATAVLTASDYVNGSLSSAPLKQTAIPVLERLQQRLQLLESLHVALEAVAALAVHAFLPDSTLRSCAHGALDFYAHNPPAADCEGSYNGKLEIASFIDGRECSSDDNTAQVRQPLLSMRQQWLDLPVPAHAITKLLSGLTPDTWCERLAPEDSTAKDWILEHYCKRPQFSHIIDASEGTGAEDAEMYYHVEVLTSVSIM